VTTANQLRYLRDVAPAAEFFYAPCGYGGPHNPRPGQGADGYGRKISTDYVVRYGGRTRRVYVCQCSNAGTAYVVDGGRWAIVTDIPDNVPPLPAEYRGAVVTR